MLKLEIVTPERVVHRLSGDVVLLPTPQGQIGIRREHLPLITPLVPGEVFVRSDNGSEEFFAVSGGFAEVLADEVIVLADSAERAEELNEQQIHEAIERARHLQQEAREEHEFADAAAQLEANLARLRAIRRRKSRGRSTLEDSSS